MDDVRPPASAGVARSRGVLAVLCTAQFVLILDIAVVNVALVPLARDLAAAPDTLQLVVPCASAAVRPCSRMSRDAPARRRPL